MHASPELAIELDWQAYPRMPNLAKGVLMNRPANLWESRTAERVVPAARGNAQ
jgi:hypothetical protein